MAWFGAGLLLLIAVTGFLLVRERDVTSQTISLSFYGLMLALMFFFFRAPDVSLSQITVGALALPLMIMLALSRMKVRSAANDRAQSDEGDSHE
jgi:energy-converting hydrogenase B subunit D